MPFEINKNGLTDLFPVPKPFRSVELPSSTPTPGASPTSTTALREALRDNHKRFHCFFNDAGFHNHASHSLLALWHLGADAETIRTGYAASISYQRPAFASPGGINKDNWTDHLGNEKYYAAYLAFFTAEFEAEGPSAILEEYVFSAAANHPNNEKKVQMLNRFLDGLVHPLIHCGYGYELGIPGMVIEGLAQAAVHPGDSDSIVPASAWKGSGKEQSNSTSSLLSIFSRILADPGIPPPTAASEANMYSETVLKYGTQILKHTNTWLFNASNEGELSRALEEIAWVATIMYAVCGSAGNDVDAFNADFFYMHIVTSSLFLPCIASHLQPASQELLLRSYIAIIFGWFIIRGKPNLDIKAFFSNNKTEKSLITTASTHSGPSYVLPDASKASPNPWTEIIQLGIIHPDEHAHKLQRTLLHYAQSYGTREAGYFGDTELKDADKLDGTLFVRAANISALRLNKPPTIVKIPGGEFPLYGDRRGFYQK